MFKTLIDEQVGLTYIGKADPGSLTSDPVWQILKLTDESVLYAEGTEEFIKIWDDRDSYTYN